MRCALDPPGLSSPIISDYSDGGPLIASWIDITLTKERFRSFSVETSAWASRH